MASGLDRALVVVGRGLRTEHRRLLEMLGHGEYGVGIGEVDDCDRIGVGVRWARRPLGDQPGRVRLVIVVPQEAHVHVEERNQFGQHLLAHRDRGGGVDGHELRRDRCDEQFEAAWHLIPPHVPLHRPQPYCGAEPDRARRLLRTVGRGA